MKEDVFKMLEKVALANPYDVKMASAIVRRGKIIAFGTNSNKSHPLQAKYGKNKESIVLHAEISAIKNALREMRLEDLEKCDIYVLRLKKTRPFGTKWVWGMSRPCIGCQRAIKAFSLKKAFYTMDDGSYGEEEY